MIRPVTFLTMLLSAGSGLYLYQTKHAGVLLDRKIESVTRATDETRHRIAMLQADYALLNDPERLQALTTAHLPGLVPTAPGQFTTIDELEGRLPPVGAPKQSPPASLPLMPLAAAVIAPPQADATTMVATSGPAALPLLAATPRPLPASLSAQVTASAPLPAVELPQHMRGAHSGPAHPAARRAVPIRLATRTKPHFVPAGDPLSIPAAATGPAAAPAWAGPPRPMIRSALGIARALAPAAAYYPASGPGTLPR